MSFAIVWAGVGAHRKRSRLELAVDIARLEGRLTAVTTERDQYEAQLDTAGIELSGCREDLAAAVAEIKQLQQKVIRSAAEHQRLRQAVVNARPRITVVDTQLVRPYAPVVVLPYISPIPVPVQHGYADDPIDDED